MRAKNESFERLFAYIKTVPVVDCHDHTAVAGPKYSDPIAALMDGYYATDIASVAGNEARVYEILDPTVPWRERFPQFKAWVDLSWHTGYGMVIKRVLNHFYGYDSLTMESMEGVEKNLLDLTDGELFDDILAEAGIVVRIADTFGGIEEGRPEANRVLDGCLKLAPRARLTIPMVHYHGIVSYDEFQERMKPLNRQITSLDEYLDGCFEIFQAYKELGAVAFKDQSAYTRSLAYGNPSKAEAEAVFNWIMSDPRRKAGYPEPSQVLDDYLFHSFLRMAKKLDLPVQLHTGLLAGLRNNIAAVNAVHLIPVLELHRDVRFDLFHANWPYGGEWLFLGKNYPNVFLNFCWANIIDPIYCQNLFQQCVSVVPHGKVFAYGSDFVGQADHAWAHAIIMRENLAIALSNLVEIEYITENEARKIAVRWLYANPNGFFKLGLPEFSA